MGTSAITNKTGLTMSNIEQAVNASLADPRPSTVVETAEQAEAVAAGWSQKVQEDVMPSLQRIENQVSSLPEQELRKFRTWFDEFDSQRWDAAIVSDINNCKLDSLAAEAIAQYSTGQCKPL